MSEEQLEIEYLNEQAFSEWDDYVKSHDQGNFFHLSGWSKVLADGLRHKPYYLLARSGGKIIGVLPLAQVKSILFGNSLISTPFCVQGGALCDNYETAIALENRAKSLARQLNVDYLELRGNCHGQEDFLRKDLYVNFKKEIDPDVEKNLAAIPRKQRAMVRKGINNNLYGAWDSDIERFYRAYSESVRNLGTPIFPKRYFSVLREVFGDAISILTICREQELIASVLSFQYKGCIMPYYGGGVEKARSVKGNDFMYWELMKRSAEDKLHYFDYGRSKKGTGSYSFKKNWGFEAQELHHYYYLVRAKTIPELNPLNPKYRFFIAVWKKLPLPVANFVGPFLARSLG